MRALAYLGRIASYLGIALSATYPDPEDGFFYGGLLIIIGSFLIELDN